MKATAHEPVTSEALVAAVDLGRIRVFRVVRGGDDPVERDHLVEVFDERREEAGRPMRESVSDQAGRFGRHGMAGLSGGMARGDEHNLASETERRSVHQVAQLLAGVLQTHGHPPWRLIAPKPILAAIQDALPPPCHQNLCRSEPGDLTKEPVAKLEHRLGLGA